MDIIRKLTDFRVWWSLYNSTADLLSPTALGQTPCPGPRSRAVLCQAGCVRVPHQQLGTDIQAPGHPSCRDAGAAQAVKVFMALVFLVNAAKWAEHRLEDMQRVLLHGV